MHQKQKINLASRIIARGLLVLNQYFPNPQVHEAFFNAGVKFVVTSRIETNDKHTAIIMKEFYNNLLEIDVAAALSKTRTYFSK